MNFKISAPGKIILIGEHSVVYNKPAIVMAIDQRIECNLEKKNNYWQIYAKSSIPRGSGMGSSAALAVCQIALVSKIFNLNLNLEKINDFAYELEKKRHGNPSGIDNTIATFGGLLYYQKLSEGKKVIKQIQIGTHLTDKFLLINTGKPKESTKEMISCVRSLFSKEPVKTQRILDNQEKLVNQIMGLIMDHKENSGNTGIEEIFRQTEDNLEKLGVVSKFTKTLINNLEKLGGIAKITGAGGFLERSGLVLAYCQDKKKVKDFCRHLNLEATDVKIANTGLQIKCI